MARPSTETISSVPLFAGLEKRDLERIADSFKERNYSAGDTIAGEGQGGAGFFIIGEGTAKVTVGGEDRAALGPGDYFGEIALIDEGARTATVTRPDRHEDLRDDVLGVQADRRDQRPDRVEARPGPRAQVARGGRAAGRLLETSAGELPSQRDRSSSARAGSPDSATVSTSGSGSSTRPPKTTQRVPASSDRRATSPGALPSKLVASTRPSPVTTRS